jgi:hypothetical protein
VDKDRITEQTQEMTMRRSLSLLAATVIAVAASAASIAPSEAAAMSRVPAPAAAITDGKGSAVEQVRHRRHKGWRHSWNDDHRHHRRHHRRHGRHFNNFYFGFPFAFVPRSHRFPSSCYRTWDGALICS